jgi:outer membrane protein assembly factor BamD
MQAYVNYKARKYDDAIVAANRFITLHPGHKDAAYAHYLVALSDFERINDTKRDQTSTRRALEALEEIERRFPDTPYAEDASQKALVARDHLAGKEMQIGRYYYKQGSYLAGINRFKRVVTEYQNTSQTPEALYRLSEGYMALGVVSEAQTAAAVLGYNFPNSEWYKDAYQLVSSDGQAPVENKESWISKTFRAINPM